MITSAVSVAAVVAQETATDPAAAEDATPEATESPETEAQEAAAEPVPEFNGTASGSISGTSLSVPVVCTGFDGGGVITADSDPGGAAGADDNGDGVVVDVNATRDGSINLLILAGGIEYAFGASGAEISDKSLRYSVTLSFASGKDDVIDLELDCG